ncbi:nitroreductase family protein, partial [Bacillus subtilis subsp. subtilis]|uniref:nitroreductase family protein n=1 Tax=Bacillus subtilis TaxID=1423 RepID=UPI00196B8785
MTTSMTASEAMLSRHSVRKYVPNTPIAATELNEILELASSAPSSWNLQHWRFLVFQQDETKRKLLPISDFQQQVVS